MHSCDIPNHDDLMASLDSPGKIHGYIVQYNWDEGFEIPLWLIRSPHCDRGTALMMYWVAGPRFYGQYHSRDEVPQMGWFRQHYDFLIELEERYLSGFYTHVTIKFDPTCDPREKMAGYDWTKEYLEIPELRRVPEQMYAAVVPAANGREG